MTGKAAYHKLSAEEAYEMMAPAEGRGWWMFALREEYDGGHIENAVLVPNESIGSEMPEALPDKEATLIYRRSGRKQGCRMCCWRWGIRASTTSAASSTGPTNLHEG